MISQSTAKTARIEEFPPYCCVMLSCHQSVQSTAFEYMPNSRKLIVFPKLHDTTLKTLSLMNQVKHMKVLLLFIKLNCTFKLFIT